MSNQLTPDTLAALVELEKKATPGEWVFICSNKSPSYPHVYANRATVLSGNNMSNIKNDLRFSAALRNDAPELLAAARRGLEADALLRQLYAIVDGECPSLLDEDSGGWGQLDVAINAHLKGGDDE